MRVATTPHHVALAIRRAGPVLVGIDGRPGAGKSKLARSLGKRLSARVVSLDELLRKRQGCYVRALRLPQLHSALAQSGTIIVEGACLLRALDRIDKEPDLLIYVKRLNRGRWLDEDELAPTTELEAHLAQLRTEARMFGGSGDLGVSEEIIRYHYEKQPHLKARLTYARADA